MGYALDVNRKRGFADCKDTIDPGGYIVNDKTEINSDLNAEENNQNIQQLTIVNPDIAAASCRLSAGSMIAGKYEVIEPMNVSTGEADLYICKYDRKKYVVKVYRRQRGIKPEVLTALKSINSPYIASVYDTGEYNERPFVVLPYYKNGSLQGRRFTFEELKKFIIPSINEALGILHQNDIIHKDLKPSNIMLRSDNKSIAVIDFGISSVVEEGSTVLITQTGMTPEYSAPETFRSLFLEESDYYSFGITVYELFCGYTPYKNMTAEKIAQFTTVQRIPFPENMPQELRDFISAVTYFDITNRSKKENPNRRWTYTEVCDWCNGKKQMIPGESADITLNLSIPAYTFLKQKYKDIPSLTVALASNWNDGQKQLYRGLMSAFFKNFNPEIAGYCMDAEEAAAGNKGKYDIVFWNLLYKIYPQLNGFYWRGQAYESLQALGCEMLEKLWKNDESDFYYWDSILVNELLSSYLTKTKSENESLAAAVSAIEISHVMGRKDERIRLMNYYTLAYLLSGRKIFRIGDKQFKNVTELADHMKGLFDLSYGKFQRFCHKLIQSKDRLDVQLEAWLIALGKRKELEAWRKQLPG